MKKTLLLMIAAISAIFSTAYQAQAQNPSSSRLNGNSLYERCAHTDSSDPTFVQRSVCLGYIMGATDPYAGTALCIPYQVQHGQLQEIVTKYLANNPHLRHYKASDLVVDALKQFFPC